MIKKLLLSLICCILLLGCIGIKSYAAEDDAIYVVGLDSSDALDFCAGETKTYGIRFERLINNEVQTLDSSEYIFVIQYDTEDPYFSAKISNDMKTISISYDAKHDTTRSTNKFYIYAYDKEGNFIVRNTVETQINEVYYTTSDAAGTKRTGLLPGDKVEFHPVVYKHENTGAGLSITEVPYTKVIMSISSSIENDSYFVNDKEYKSEYRADFTKEDTCYYMYKESASMMLELTVGFNQWAYINYGLYSLETPDVTFAEHETYVICGDTTEIGVNISHKRDDFTYKVYATRVVGPDVCSDKKMFDDDAFSVQDGKLVVKTEVVKELDSEWIEHDGNIYRFYVQVYRGETFLNEHYAELCITELFEEEPIQGYTKNPFINEKFIINNYGYVQFNTRETKQYAQQMVDINLVKICDSKGNNVTDQVISEQWGTTYFCFDKVGKYKIYETYTSPVTQETKDLILDIEAVSYKYVINDDAIVIFETETLERELVCSKLTYDVNTGETKSDEVSGVTYSVTPWGALEKTKLSITGNKLKVTALDEKDSYSIIVSAYKNGVKLCSEYIMIAITGGYYETKKYIEDEKNFKTGDVINLEIPDMYYTEYDPVNKVRIQTEVPASDAYISFYDMDDLSCIKLNGESVKVNDYYPISEIKSLTLEVPDYTNYYIADYTIYANINDIYGNTYLENMVCIKRTYCREEINDQENEENTNNPEKEKKITVAKVKKLSLKKSGKTKLKISWTANKTVKGYEIQYSTSKKFKSAKKVTIKSAKTKTKTISKLKKGKTYYVRIRAYKMDGKKKVYSGWSSVKKVKMSK